MENRKKRSRWLTVMILFFFLLFNQFLGFFIEPITMVVSAFSSITERWLDDIFPTDLIFMMLFLLVGGILFDRSSRKPLLSFGSFLWGVSAWLMGISPTFATFTVSKALYGISRVSFSGIYAMASDYFKPYNRSKIFSLLLLAHPLSIVLGTILQDVSQLEQSWRLFLILMGVAAFSITLAIQTKATEPERGAMEPALSTIPMKGTYRLTWEKSKNLLTKPSLILIYLLILFGTLPTVTLLEGLVIYLCDVHGLLKPEVYSSILPGMLGVVLGYPIGGIFGDLAFKIKKTGRLLPCLAGFLVPSIFLICAHGVTDVRSNLFLFYILMIGLFMALSLSNLMASIMDVTLPELRASATAIGLFFQTLSFLMAPTILSIGLKNLPIGALILWMCIVPWTICLGLLTGLFFFIQKDIEVLRSHMAYRGLMETKPTRLEGWDDR